MSTADFLRPETVQALEALAAEMGVRDPRLQQLRWWATAEGGRDRFLQVCAHIKQKVRRALGEASGPYIIAPLPARQGRTARYTISLRKELLHFS